MTDLRSPRWIGFQGIAFLAILGLAAGLLLAQSPAWTTLVLVALLIWSSARFYDFLFYVLERYVDSRLRDAVVIPLLRALHRGRRTER
jgi:hypothetical protein